MVKMRLSEREKNLKFSVLNVFEMNDASNKEIIKICNKILREKTK